MESEQRALYSPEGKKDLRSMASWGLGHRARKGNLSVYPCKTSEHFDPFAWCDAPSDRDGEEDDILVTESRRLSKGPCPFQHQVVLLHGVRLPGGNCQLVWENLQNGSPKGAVHGSVVSLACTHSPVSISWCMTGAGPGTF